MTFTPKDLKQNDLDLYINILPSQFLYYYSSCKSKVMNDCDLDPTFWF